MNPNDPVFKQPKDLNAKVWRYMDFTKYVSLLKTRSLYFARSDRFEDQFEGADTFATYQFRRSLGGNTDKALAFHAEQSRNAELERQWLFINCWHMNDYESMAMWKIYCRSNEAVAIQSTYSRLRKSLAVVSYPFYLGMGLVNYVDYQRDVIPAFASFYRFVHKRRAFEYEREVRVILREAYLPEFTSGEELSKALDGLVVDMDNPNMGHLLKVKLSVLIGSVHIAPGAEPWFKDLVCDISRKYRMSRPILSSELDEKPVY